MPAPARCISRAITSKSVDAPHEPLYEKRRTRTEIKGLYERYRLGMQDDGNESSAGKQFLRPIVFRQPSLRSAGQGGVDDARR
jgi:hypothetical protein